VVVVASWLLLLLVLVVVMKPKGFVINKVMRTNLSTNSTHEKYCIMYKLLQQELL
jgi:hypothetical protein